MLPLAFLPLELILASFVVAQSSTECTRNNLNEKFNNKLGQSPCTVRNQLRQACASNDSSSLNCTCNNVYYNLCAACSLCAGDDPQPWSTWAIGTNCASGPMPFQPPPPDQLANTMIPNWAYQQLTSQQDFDIVGALTGSGSSKGLSSAARIAVYVTVPVGVGVLAFLAAWLYFRHKWRKDRNSRPTWSSEEGSILSYPQQWIQRVRLSLKSRRLQSSRKDSGWAIDEDSYPLHARSTSYNDPYHPTEQVASPSAVGDRDLGQSRTSIHHQESTHHQEPSSSSLFSRITSPGIRVPTIMQRLVGFRDSLRRSATYTFRYVSPTSADPSFRIDGSEPTPVDRTEFNTIADFRLPPHAAVPSFRQERERHAAERDAQAAASGSDPLSNPETVTDNVLVISRNGEDFSMEDTATTVHSPRTPMSARPPPSAYSGSRSATRTGTAASQSGTSSWLPSPRRANTSSTRSGAYPHELRRNPDLVWSSQFPPPPSTFTFTQETARTFLPGPAQTVSPERMAFAISDLERARTSSGNP